MLTKVGCDPEGFLFNGYEYISAFGLFPGTKDEPFKVDKGMFQVDGLALEFGIDPAETEDEFESNIKTVLAQLTEHIKYLDKSFELHFVPMVHFDIQYFKDLPDDCKLLGCEPDFGLQGQMKSPDEELMHRPFRSAGGHVHIGWTANEDPFDAKHFEDCRFIADRFKNKPYFLPVSNEEKARVKYYGGIGSFRPKSYGVELRSPSNVWVASEENRRKMFNNIIHTMSEIRK